MRVFWRSTCRAYKWVHTANVTLLWQSDTAPGLLPSPQGACVWGQAPSLFYDKDVTFPALCVCLTETEREKESWLNNNRSTSVKLLILPKSLKWDLTHTLIWIHTHCKCWPLCMSRFNYITWGPDCGPSSVHRPLRDTRQSAMQK